MSAQEADYFPEFRSRRGWNEPPDPSKLESECKALRARVHFLEGRCHILEATRPRADDLTPDQAAILNLLTRVQALEATLSTTKEKSDES